MKKILFIALFIIAIISLSFAFTDDNPKKANKHQCTEASAQQTSAATGATCAHKPDSVAGCAKHSENCQKNCEKHNAVASDSTCSHHKEMADQKCKEHQKMTAEAGVKSSDCPKGATCKHSNEKK